MRKLVWLLSVGIFVGLLSVVATAAGPEDSRSACGSGATSPQPPPHPAPHDVPGIEPVGPPEASPVAARFSRATGRGDTEVSERPDVSAIRAAHDPECGEVYWEVVLSDGSTLGVPLEPTRVETSGHEVIVHFK